MAQFLCLVLCELLDVFLLRGIRPVEICHRNSLVVCQFDLKPPLHSDIELVRTEL
jgi:hypothetical protein